MAEFLSKGKLTRADIAITGAGRNGTLFRVKDMGVYPEFSGDNATVTRLYYAESHSIVSFMVEQYGWEKMRALLKALDTIPTDTAFTQVLGTDLLGVERLWRAWIGVPLP